MATKGGRRQLAGADYHHGNLRRTLMRAGIKTLKSDGVAGLSMRKLAREAGVSHNAPYMHFRNKQSVVAGLAEEGFRQLRAAILRARSKHEDNWRDQLFAGSIAYVKYGKRNKALMDIMFLEYDEEEYPSLCEGSEAALHLLTELVERGQVAGEITDGDARQYAISIWALLHGIAMILAGRKGPVQIMGESLEELTTGHLQRLLDGLLK